MRKLFTVVAAIFLSACLSGTTWAQAPGEGAATLHVGDAAPALTPGKWLKGEPVTKFDKDKIYVVEFWATWCAPCRQSIPHLTELQEKYKDVTFIGQDCWEQEQTGVPDFVAQMGDKMNYRVAQDDMTHSDKGQMATNWMAAAGQNGIPTAFVIDKESKIAWIGHPMELDGILKEVVAGTFDAKKVAAAAEAKQGLEQKFGQAMQLKHYDEALGILDEVVKADPSMTDQISFVKFNILLRKKDYPAAWELGRKLADTLKDKPDQLNAMAWVIVSPQQPVEKPDLELAEQLATRAVEASKGEDGGTLDTLARVYFAKGQIDKAIETQTKAVEKTSGPEKAQLQKNLDEYKAASNKAGKPESK